MVPKVPKDKGTGTMAGPFQSLASAFGNNRRRGFTLTHADVLRAACDAKKSQHRCRQKKQSSSCMTNRCRVFNDPPSEINSVNLLK
jgi:hypothetical protein